MKTHYTEDPVEAASFLRDGKLVVFPTETVYGLGANALDDGAVSQIYDAKQRPDSNPLIVHLASIKEALRVALEIPPSAQLLMEAFFPGPLTLVLQRHPSVPEIVTGGLDTIAVRIPSHPTALELLKTAALPIAAPSANLSGRPSATSWESAAEDLHDRVHCILCGDAATIGLESTVVDCTDQVPVLLRPGAISLESLTAIISEFSSDAIHLHRSPGMLYHHYAPDAKIRLVDASSNVLPEDNAGYIGLGVPSNVSSFRKCLIAKDIEDYSHRLFEFFRTCDRSGVEVIYCERVMPVDLGRALMDRLEKAATSTKSGKYDES